jgi:hypothetical protein
MHTDPPPYMRLPDAMISCGSSSSPLQVTQISCLHSRACPISLNPGQCGHTFCALCILKWFFSRLHKACGGWHESVDCPIWSFLSLPLQPQLIPAFPSISRSLLIITPDHSPRLDITFPFTPNRTVDALVRDLIGKLADSPSSDDITAGGTTGAKKTEDTMAEWRTGGTTRTEWFRRDSYVPRSSFALVFISSFFLPHPQDRSRGNQRNNKELEEPDSQRLC